MQTLCCVEVKTENVPKVTPHLDLKPRKGWCYKLSNIKWKALGSKKFLILFIDYNRDYCILRLVKQKDNLEGKGLALFKKIRHMGIQLKLLQSDNAEENKSLKKALESEEFNIDFQYSAAGTPQQNSRVEQKIVTYTENFARH